MIGALIGRRLLNAVPVLLLVALGTFALLEAAPGDAADAYLSNLGGDAGLVADLRRRWGLDGSFAGRFAAYLTALAQLDFGYSVAFSRPVFDVVAGRLANTLLLMSAATAFAFSIGIALGAAAGARPGSWTDRIFSTVALILHAAPSFWLGLMLIAVFSVSLAWLPLGGLATIGSEAQGLAWIVDRARHLVLPVATLGLVYAALSMRLMRAGMIEALRSDHVLLARAKGLTRGRLVRRHVVRNALLPVVTVLGLQAGAMLGGSVVVESVFAIPGLGRLAYEAVTQRDQPLLAGVALTGAVAVIAINLLVDLAYARIDPRIAG